MSALPPALIEACYRLLLGRAPESAEAITDKTALPGYDALLSTFLASDEHARRIPPQFEGYYYTAPPKVQVVVAEADRAAMFERIRQEWSKLGEADPYWSVLTEDVYRSGAIDDEARAVFFRSGAAAAGLIDLMAARAGVAPALGGTCLELGCGVGRVTAHLARRFDRVIAVDVSAGNLDICRQTLAREGIDNVEVILIGEPSDIAALPGFDFLFSTIVLQHNPPPVQHYILDQLLAKIAPGGGFLFQLPTHMPGYSFDAADYLASPAGGMEMHGLPMADVFRLLAAHGLSPLEVIMDAWTGLYGSHTFFGVKAATAGSNP